MATTQTTHFPATHPAQAYTTPPNSQGYQPYPPQLPYLQQPQQYPPQFPPMESSSTPTPTPPTNISPTSPSAFTNANPSLPLANRQLRHPKSPMYIPAALRPTERPHRASPLTPPRSVHGSTDSLAAEDRPAARPLSRRSTDHLKKAAGTNTLADLTEGTPDLNAEAEEEPAIPTSDLPAVTDPPTRSHWKPDSNAPICDAPVCAKHFSLFERRHHCRHCGNIFCAEHSSWTIPLDQDANFHPKGAVCKGCGHCWGEYNRWIDERAQGNFGGGISRTESTPIQAKKPAQAGGQRNSIAQSLSRDWNWSTF